QGGKLYYLVRGSGFAYAAVASHRLNNGPLHEALLREWRDGDSWHWVPHDLSAYRGQRVQIDFSPLERARLRGDESPQLAIAMVVEADRPPDSVVRQNELVLRLLRTTNGGDLAPKFADLIRDAAQRLAGDQIVSSEHASAYAELADWLV